MGPINLRLLSFFFYYSLNLDFLLNKGLEVECRGKLLRKKSDKPNKKCREFTTYEMIEIREKLLHLTSQGYYIEKV